MKLTKRKIFIILIALLMIWFMCPVIGGVLHIGMIYPTLILAIPLLILLFPEKAKSIRNGRAKIFVRICAFCLCTGLLFIIGVAGWMAYAAIKPAHENATAIILGCQVRGEELSRMLTDRVNKAIDYLNENPDSVCVASGGQGNGEDISEAEAIRRYLISHGISEDRIYLEDKSTSTYENLTFSAEVIKENGLCTDAVIASDNFHQLRAAIFAEQNGLEASPLGTGTWIFLAPGYWAREVLAVTKAVIFGN